MGGLWTLFIELAFDGQEKRERDQTKPAILLIFLRVVRIFKYANENTFLVWVITVCYDSLLYSTL